jgi:hypothetical protein
MMRRKRKIPANVKKIACGEVYRAAIFWLPQVRIAEEELNGECAVGRRRASIKINRGV